MSMDDKIQYFMLLVISVLIVILAVTKQDRDK